MNNSQISLYPDKDWCWEDEWNEMPEYKGNETKIPNFTMTFKFTTQEDYDKFHDVIKRCLYDDCRVFDGKQGKTDKQAWYPLPPRPKEYVYITKESLQ